jgi:3-hydroxybutyryl-CoA dehydrogenase
MDQINKILVLGAGTMGHGIAQIFAQSGYRVTLYDILPQALNRADTLIRSSLQTMVEAGLVKTSEIKTILSRITPTTSLEDSAQDADLAIESIVEDKEAKKELFKKLDIVCPAKTIFTSNASFLNIFDFVDTSRPDKVLAMHWYSPPQIIPLVDVVKGPETDEKNVQIITDLLIKIGKKPIVLKKPVAGYVISRLQTAFQREVFWLLDNGYLSAKDIDESAIWGLALRMLVIGIFQRIDFGGLDISAKIASQSSNLAPVDYISRKLNDLIKEGNLGVKTGRGFYDYGDKTEAEVCHERDIRLLKILKYLQENDIVGPVL